MHSSTFQISDQEILDRLTRDQRLHYLQIVAQSRHRKRREDSEEDILFTVRSVGTKRIAKSLQTVHDLALYHTTDLGLYEEEKIALMDVKTLLDSIQAFD